MSKHRSYFAPHITVATVVQAHNRFLMVEEIIAGQSTLNQPAGHLEANESLIMAASRELWEETGLTFKPTKLLGIYQWKAPDGIDFLRFTFVLDLVDCLATQPQDSDITACHWLSANEIFAWPKLRSPLVKESIINYQQQCCYPLSLLQCYPTK